MLKHNFEAECAWLMTVANRKTVSGFLHVSWRTAGAVARRVAERVKASMPSPFDGLTAIGVDETSHRKGHTYLTVVVDHERHRVIWAHDGVGGDVFDLFFKALTPEQHASIRVVTGDGARWIDPCVGRWRPNAERVLDGFHIVSWMTDALDKVRKRLWNQARRDGDEKTTKRMRGVKYAVLTSMPGIGVRTASNILLGIGGDIANFKSAAHLAAYAGIAPVTGQSGTGIKGERPSGRGNKRLKNALWQSSFVASTKHPPSIAYYQRKREQGKHHNAAVIRLARRRCDVIYSMLKNGVLYQEPALVA